MTIFAATIIPASGDLARVEVESDLMGLPGERHYVSVQPYYSTTTLHLTAEEARILAGNLLAAATAAEDADAAERAFYGE